MKSETNPKGAGRKHKFSPDQKVKLIRVLVPVGRDKEIKNLVHAYLSDFLIDRIRDGYINDRDFDAFDKLTDFRG